MPYVSFNAFYRSGSEPRRPYVARVLYHLYRAISSRLLEHRIYTEAMQELWYMPNKYRLELGIDPYEWERFARKKARLASGR